MAGPFRYSVLLGVQGIISKHQLHPVFLGERKVMNGSLIHHLFPTLSSDSLYPNIEVSVAN